MYPFRPKFYTNYQYAQKTFARYLHYVLNVLGRQFPGVEQVSDISVLHGIGIRNRLFVSRVRVPPRRLKYFFGVSANIMGTSGDETLSGGSSQAAGGDIVNKEGREHHQDGDPDGADVFGGLAASAGLFNHPDPHNYMGAAEVLPLPGARAKNAAGVSCITTES